jgi:mannan endo-1,4-beta-mannosidase
MKFSETEAEVGKEILLSPAKSSKLGDLSIRQLIGIVPKMHLHHVTGCKSCITVLVIVSLLALAGCTATKNVPDPNGRSAGVSRKHTFQTLRYLDSISGKRTIAGIHNREPNATPSRWTDEIFQTTGKFPALWSGDFLFQAENINTRKTMIEEALKQWKKGAFINLMWHACNPALSQPCGWDKNGVLSQLTDEQWQALITDGTALNQKWKGMMDEVSVYLQLLEDNQVEVMFRPLHEMNQKVFWWGGRPGPDGTRRLWQITHDYFTKTKGLSNLIWVWDIQDFPTLAADSENYFPGDAYFDIAALDVYDDSSGFSQEKYDIMVKASKGKPIAIGECQVLPTAEILAQQPRWTFFMSWSELTYEKNSVDAIKALYSAPAILTLDEIRKPK